jgi:hypothetical protein
VFDIISPQMFTSHMMLTSCGDLLFRQKKRGKYVGVLLFRRGYVTVSPQKFPAPMIFTSSGDLLFRQKKKAKLIQEVS